MSAPSTASIRRVNTGPASAAPPVLRVVSAPAKHRGYVVYLIVCVSILLGGLGAVLFLNTTLAEGSYRQQSLRNQLEVARGDQAVALEQLSIVSAPERLAAKAAELGMVPGSGVGFIDLGNGQILGGTAPQGEQGSE
jgi:hypothetical protein